MAHLHPSLARVAGVEVPGHMPVLGSWRFVPCRNQVSGDGDPGETVAMMPSGATVGGIPQYRYYWVRDPSNDNAWTFIGDDAPDGTFSGDWSVFNIKGWKIAGNRSYVDTGDGTLPITTTNLRQAPAANAAPLTQTSVGPSPQPRRPPAQPSGPRIGQTRGGGAEIYTAQGWVARQTATRPSGPPAAPAAGGWRAPKIGDTRGGGAQVFTKSGWVSTRGGHGGGGGNRTSTTTSTRTGDTILNYTESSGGNTGISDDALLALVTSAPPAASSPSPGSMSDDDLLALVGSDNSSY